ncbi:MAG: tryptophan synthase subunit alpha [Aeropyrum sp.]|nr:tryptophan synthase subunit alpha [Aeropyrum sp.]
MGLRRPGFSLYWTLGFPSLSSSLEIMDRLSTCADFLEVGIPSAKPIYDGPIVRETHRIAFSEIGGRLEPLKVLEGMDKPYTLLAYLDGLDRVGLRRLLETAASIGALCVLLPDLPFERPEMLNVYVGESLRAGLKPCFFASSRFPHGWLTGYSELDPLYVYLGLQPATGVKLPVDVFKNVALAKRLVGDTYLVAGFSVRSPSIARDLVKAGADGVVVGSAVIKKYVEDGLEPAARLACEIASGLRRAA